MVPAMWMLGKASWGLAEGSAELGDALQTEAGRRPGGVGPPLVVAEAENVGEGLFVVHAAKHNPRARAESRRGCNSPHHLRKATNYLDTSPTAYYYGAALVPVQPGAWLGFALRVGRCRERSDQSVLRSGQVAGDAPIGRNPSLEAPSGRCAYRATGSSRLKASCGRCRPSAAAGPLASPSRDRSANSTPSAPRTAAIIRRLLPAE